jgi:hypothetical protein
VRRAWLIGFLVVAACGHGAQPLPPAVQAVMADSEAQRWMTTGQDPWEVFVCHIPPDSQSATYAGLPLRLAQNPAALVKTLNDHVTAYFDTLSSGTYQPRFSAGGEVTIAATDEPQACVDKALAASSKSAHGVISIADAEHSANHPGGFANPGSACASPPCAASATRRSAYVGAADFSSDWGDRPPMDLVEHELGHALGWPHSGYDESAADPHCSGLDVMSNSAAPRSTEPDRRDAPGTLAINFLQAGWLPPASVAVVPAAGSTVALSPSNGTSGTRLAVVALDDQRFVTVELLTADGLDDHLPASGIAVHLVDGTGSTRSQTPLIGLAPYTDLLTVGEALSSNGWRIAVADGWRVTIQPLSNGPTVQS